MGTEKTVKVFLAWGSDLSGKVADVFVELLPLMMNAVTPFKSSAIPKGDRWSPKIATELEESQFGILCMTYDTLDNVWMHFEAGALSKQVKQSRVCPFRVGIQVSDIDGPLSIFMSAGTSKEETYKLIQSINTSVEGGIVPDDLLHKAFEFIWPNMEAKLKAIEAEALTARNKPTKTKPKEPAGEKDRDILEQVLAISRQNSQMLAETRDFVGRALSQEPQERRSAFHRTPAFRPSPSDLVRRVLRSDMTAEEAIKVAERLGPEFHSVFINRLNDGFSDGLSSKPDASDKDTKDDAQLRDSIRRTRTLEELARIQDTQKPQADMT